QRKRGPILRGANHRRVKAPREERSSAMAVVLTQTTQPERFPVANWLVVPVPADAQGQRWLLALAGTVITLFRANQSDWRRDQYNLFPDLAAALVSTGYQPPSGQLAAFQLTQYTCTASLSAVDDMQNATDVGWAVDASRPLSVTGPGSPVWNNLLDGIQVDVAARDADASLLRISYHFMAAVRIRSFTPYG